MGARVYSPVIGAFTQAEPLTGGIGEPATGLYTYSQGMVGSQSDPSGLWPQWGDVSVSIPNPADLIADQIWAHTDESFHQLVITAAQEYKGDPVARDVNLGMATVNQLAFDAPEMIKNEYFKDSHPFGWDTESKTYALGNKVAEPVSFFSPSGGPEKLAIKSGERSVAKAMEHGAEQDSLERIGRMPGCFVPGTKVLTPGGEVSIEKLKVGDKVITTDPETKRESTQAVSSVIKHENIPVYVVGTSQGKVKTTGDHPFWVKGRGWVRVENLHLGEELIQPNNTSVHVTSVGYNGEVTTVYNITVAQKHDFYVKAGSAWILVHNNDCGVTKDPREWTNSDQRQAAKNLGFSTRVGQRNSRDQYGYKDKKGKVITYDADHHNGGVWKMFENEREFLGNNSKIKRKGTYDKDLNRIKK